MKLAKEFVKFAIHELGLKSLPSDIKFVNSEYSMQNGTFGTYNPSTDEIVIVKENRHPVDVLRTLAHELVHHKQREDGKVLDGDDGSDTENEANAKAGELMRKFRTVIPEIFNIGPWGFHTNMENKLHAIKEAIRTKKMVKIDNQPIDEFSARLLLKTINELSEKNRVIFLKESINTMRAIAHKIATAK
jgi:hypothetical protein